MTVHRRCKTCIVRFGFVLPLACSLRGGILWGFFFFFLFFFLFYFIIPLRFLPMENLDRFLWGKPAASIIQSTCFNQFPSAVGISEVLPVSACEEKHTHTHAHTQTHTHTHTQTHTNTHTHTQGHNHRQCPWTSTLKRKDNCREFQLASACWTAVSDPKAELLVGWHSQF